MPSIAAERLSEAHRVAQIQNTMVTLAQTRALYNRMVVPAAPRTYEPWINQALPSILQGRQRSRLLAGRYYTQLGILETGDSTHRALDPEETDDRIETRVEASLIIVGRNGQTRRLRAERADPRAAQKTQNQVEGAIVRHVMNGGRDEIRRNVRADRKATGYVRITAMDNNVCWFCAMLASRVDYKEGSFNASDPRFKIGGNPFANAKVHDSCRCQLFPLFSDDLPSRTEEYVELWDELKEGPDDLATNFRRNWEARMLSSRQ